MGGTTHTVPAKVEETHITTIIKGVWGYPDEGSTKKLQVNMANIRKKFGVKPGEARYITNELGVGYRMNGDNADIQDS